MKASWQILVCREFSINECVFSKARQDAPSVQNSRNACVVRPRKCGQSGLSPWEFNGSEHDFDQGGAAACQPIIKGGFKGCAIADAAGLDPH